MKQFFIILLACSAAAPAQDATSQDLARQASELSSALQRDNLVSAAEIVAKLDEAVQVQRLAAMVRDSSDRAQEVLSWLPPDMESFWVNQRPFVFDEQKLKGSSAELAISSFSLDRLAAQNGGKFIDSLKGLTVRMAMAAARKIHPKDSSVGIPAPMTSGDALYFYFLTEEWKPAEHEDETLEGRPVWQGIASITGAYAPRPGVQPPKIEDKNWIALARPNLLILSNQKELLATVLKEMRNPSARGASFSEWNRVDRSASFWGIRRYTAASKPMPRTRGCDAAELPYPDCLATGVTLQFDSATHQLEVHYLSDGQLPQSGYYGDSLRREFQVTQPQPGDWRLVSDLEKRGAYPFQFAMIMLGFGDYR